MSKVRASSPLSIPDLSLAPPPFSVGESKAVFCDITQSTVDLTFDVAARQTRAKARVELNQPEEGFPVLDLVPDIQRLVVDGNELPATAFKTITDPDGTSKLRIVGEKLPSGKHTVELEYLLSKGASYDSTGVDFEVEMSDLATRNFSEIYFPAGYEYDQHPSQVKINIVGGSRQHRIMTNGDLTSHPDGSFTVDFPDYFTTSSPFLHIVNPAAYSIVSDVFEGKQRKIPLTVYGKNANTVQRAVAETKDVFKELERTYGPYSHPRFTANVGSDAFGGGMEYAGATKTSLSALSHEITHSWFARGVMPSNGNSGWLDEAIASWRDAGYPRPNAVDVGGSYPRLASFSKYRRDTTQAAYNHGMRVMSELDFYLKDSGGLKALLAELYATHAHETITTELFLDAVRKRSPVPLDDYFKKKIYQGQAPDVELPQTDNDVWPPPPELAGTPKS